jgi:hypothetical protein
MFISSHMNEWISLIKFMLRFTTYVKGKYIYTPKVFYNFSKNKPVGLVDLPSSFFLGCKLYKNGQVLTFLTVDTRKS